MNQGRSGFRNLERAETFLRARRLSIRFSRDLACLARPIRVGNKKIPNHLGIHPMEGRDADTQGRPGPLTLRRYERYGGSFENRTRFLLHVVGRIREEAGPGTWPARFSSWLPRSRIGSRGRCWH